MQMCLQFTKPDPAAALTLYRKASHAARWCSESSRRMRLRALLLLRPDLSWKFQEKH